MGADRWVVTAHAVRRYVKRIDPTITEREAWSHLSSEVTRSVLLDGPTYTGQQRWLLPRRDAVAVVKIDHDIGAHVAVTVLKPDELYDPETAGEIVNAYRRAMRARQKMAETTSQETSSSSYRDKYLSLMAKYQQLMNAHDSLSTAANLISHEAIVDEMNSIRVALAHANGQLRTIKRGADTESNVRKYREHAERTEATARTQKELLRDTIRMLREGALPGIILAHVGSREPGIVSDAFCYPSRFAKEERRAMTELARATPDDAP